MGIGVEVEEWAGSVWQVYHPPSGYRFPEAQVELEDMQHSLAVLFRALGGATGLQWKHLASGRWFASFTDSANCR